MIASPISILPDVALFRPHACPVGGVYLPVGSALGEPHSLCFTALHERVAHAGPVAVFGRPRSGKSQFLQMAAVALAFHHTAEEAQIAAIGEDLRWIDQAPQTAILVAAEPGEAAEVIAALLAALDRRVALFAEAGVRTLADYNGRVSGVGCRRRVASCELRIASCRRLVRNS